MNPASTTKSTSAARNASMYARSASSSSFVRNLPGGRNRAGMPARAPGPGFPPPRHRSTPAPLPPAPCRRGRHRQWPRSSSLCPNPAPQCEIYAHPSRGFLTRSRAGLTSSKCRVVKQEAAFDTRGSHEEAETCGCLLRAHGPAGLLPASCSHIGCLLLRGASGGYPEGIRRVSGGYLAGSGRLSRLPRARLLLAPCSWLLGL